MPQTSTIASSNRSRQGLFVGHRLQRKKICWRTNVHQNVATRGRKRQAWTTPLAPQTRAAYRGMSTGYSHSGCQVSRCAPRAAVADVRAASKAVTVRRTRSRSVSINARAGFPHTETTSLRARLPEQPRDLQDRYGPRIMALKELAEAMFAELRS